MDRFGRFKLIAMICNIAGVASFGVFVYVMTIHKIFWANLLTGAFFPFFFSMTIPVYFNLAAETVYPCGEAQSTSGLIRESSKISVIPWAHRFPGIFGDSIRAQ